MTSAVATGALLLVALLLWLPPPPSARLARLRRAGSVGPGAVAPRAPRVERLQGGGRQGGGRQGGGRGRGSAKRPARGVDPALLLDLVAAALDAGAPPLAALEAAGSALALTSSSREDEELRGRCALLRLGAGWDEAWLGATAALVPVRDALGLALRAGAPGADLLRDAASEVRRRRAREAQRRAQALGVRLVLPLGACALPAFVAVAVVPVVVSLAQEVLG
ncbi:type II secretion system F family protein [uncultured Pseudokineococcus sp.]|uniref:type II secretion system F family protein n=1 Tax=uncultured Pseudokineococcus sp. TaxID=1642928 RepID=UPI0026099952|nr:type II secretion system F family protein [uncultured Pseudokineococcus sp.]